MTLSFHVHMANSLHMFSEMVLIYLAAWAHYKNYILKSFNENPVYKKRKRNVWIHNTFCGVLVYWPSGSAYNKNDCIIMIDFDNDDDDCYCYI